MEFEKLLRTRNFVHDYQWFYKPFCMDDYLENQLSFLTKLMHKSELKTYFSGESLKNIFYIYDENGSVLIRSGFSGQLDRQGRSIYSVEGLACTAEENRLFWYALPYLIDWLAGQPLLRDQWLRGNQEELPQEEALLELEALTEDALFEDVSAPGSLWHRMKDHSACMQQLIKDVKTSSEMFSLMYVTQPSVLFDAGNMRVYSADALQEMPPVFTKQLHTQLTPIIPDLESDYRIQIEVEKRDKKYEAFLVAYDRHGEGLGETEAVRIDKNGASFEQLEKARITMEARMTGMGYRRRQKRYDY